MCDWQFMSWSRTKIPFSCQVFKSPKSFEHESTVTTTGLELDLYRRRSLKVQSQSVNETIGQMMLYNKLKASVTSGSLVCGELFYASESPLEPERRRLTIRTIILAVRIRNFTHDFCDWTAEKKPRLNRIVL